MEGPAHGALVAGVSSCVTAGWIRKRVIEEYNPKVRAPSVQDRLRQRIPTVVAGIGFTGLSAAVAYGFDTLELSMLAEAGDPRSLNQQIEHHRQLHSLPYLGSAVAAAHLIRHGSSKFAQWLTSKFDVPNVLQETIQALDDLAEWIINASGVGILGHLVGDIPTKGRGGTALQLLKPITNYNFSLQWVSSAAEPLNKYLCIAGAILTGAAWTFNCSYILSWEPPEQRLISYVRTLRQYENYSDVLRHIINDIKNAFKKIVEQGSEFIHGSPLLNDFLTDPGENKAHRWFQMDIDPSNFGVPAFNKRSLVREDILPGELRSIIEAKPLYSSEYVWPQSNGVPLVADPDAAYRSDLISPIFKSDTDLLCQEGTKANPLYRDYDDQTTLYREPDASTSLDPTEDSFFN